MYGSQPNKDGVGYAELIYVFFFVCARCRSIFEEAARRATQERERLLVVRPPTPCVDVHVVFVLVAKKSQSERNFLRVSKSPSFICDLRRGQCDLGQAF